MLGRALFRVSSLAEKNEPKVIKQLRNDIFQEATHLRAEFEV